MCVKMRSLTAIDVQAVPGVRRFGSHALRVIVWPDPPLQFSANCSEEPLI